MARYEKAFYQPMLSDWRSYPNWELAGARDAVQRATDLWQQALTEYEEPLMDPAIRDELEAYVAKRREEIGNDEP
jgi:trimethylamine--corrinoid protein Co-methyltransferase